jgi:uncharacterized membrane protein YbhN (UPF0104 family)
MVATTSSTAKRRPHSRRRSRWALVRRVLGILFVSLVVVLIYRKMSTIDWSAVLTAVQSFQLRTLAPAFGLVVLSYCLHASFDLLGRSYAGHHLRAPRVMSIAYVSYAFNLNLGALVGGLGLRYRLYSHAGLNTPQIAKVYSIGVVTNWIGYCLLAGVVLASGLVVLPEEWGRDPLLLRAGGVLLLVVAIGYVLACAFAKRRHLTLRGHTFDLPSLRFALMQCALSVVNWLTIATVIHALLPHETSWSAVVGVVLVSSLAGAVAHIPAGLGVLETVFLVLLGGTIPHHALLAGLVAYRAMYYLLPMAPAVAAYFWMEVRHRKASASTAAA